MDDRRKQFVRILDEVLPLVRQVRSAASLAPRRELTDRMTAVVQELEALRDEKSFWFYGQDSLGRFQSESGQMLEVSDE